VTTDHNPDETSKYACARYAKICMIMVVKQAKECEGGIFNDESKAYVKHA